jgi:hypothetical protein
VGARRHDAHAISPATPTAGPCYCACAASVGSARRIEDQLGAAAVATPAAFLSTANTLHWGRGLDYVRVLILGRALLVRCRQPGVMPQRVCHPRLGPNGSMHRRSPRKPAGPCLSSTEARYSPFAVKGLNAPTSSGFHQFRPWEQPAGVEYINTQKFCGFAETAG